MFGMLALALLLLLGHFALDEAPPDLDCARPAAARDLIGRVRLSEIEWAEDVQREALWQAFGRCSTRPGADACREVERKRFDAQWTKQKAAIEAKYDQILRDFTQRCQASIA